jgi:hypothetical protein
LLEPGHTVKYKPLLDWAIRLSTHKPDACLILQRTSAASSCGREVYWAASDVGWVVSHSYIVYPPLLHGCTSILYEGKPLGTPDAGA